MGTSSSPEILVVDDDPVLRSTVGEALLERGYRVVEAAEGEAALRRITESEPRLILLDMEMPTMDGWSFARALRERYGRRIPVIVMTARDSSRLRADEIGANADLGKPFDLERLYEVVADTIGPP
jgi:CheY-like chemotaxis protein